MGHKHSQAEILDGALAVVRAEGLSQLTYGRVARHLGIHDRTVVYYFASKDELAVAVVHRIGQHLQETLATALPETAADHLDLCRATWPALATSSTDWIFALFFEAVGLAAAGRAPYESLVPQLITGWIDGLSECFEGTRQERRKEAEAAVALIDGLLLFRQSAGAAAAERVAKRWGIS